MGLLPQYLFHGWTHIAAWSMRRCDACDASFGRWKPWRIFGLTSHSGEGRSGDLECFNDFHHLLFGTRKPPRMSSEIARGRNRSTGISWRPCEAPTTAVCIVLSWKKTIMICSHVFANSENHWQRTQFKWHVFGHGNINILVYFTSTYLIRPDMLLLKSPCAL